MTYEEEIRRERMILHAIHRARERHALELTKSDIAALSAQYRTPNLPVILDNSQTPFHHWIKGQKARVICWSADYQCYVAFDEGLRTIVTFLPKDWTPKTTPVRMIERTAPSIIRHKHATVIRHLGGRPKQREKSPVPAPPEKTDAAPKQKKISGLSWVSATPVAHIEVGGRREFVERYGRDWFPSVLSYQEAPKRYQSLRTLVLDAVIEWFCERTGRATFRITWHSDTPSREIILPSGETVNAGWFYGEYWREIKETLHEYLTGESFDWGEFVCELVKIKGWEIRADGLYDEQDYWIARDPQQLIDEPTLLDKHTIRGYNRDVWPGTPKKKKRAAHASENELPAVLPQRERYSTDVPSMNIAQPQGEKGAC